MGKRIFLKSGESTTLTTNGKDCFISASRLGEEFAIKIIFVGANLGILARSPKIEAINSLLEKNYIDKNHISITVNGGDGSKESEGYLSCLKETFNAFEMLHPGCTTITYDTGITHDNGSMLLGSDLDLISSK